MQLGFADYGKKLNENDDTTFGEKLQSKRWAFTRSYGVRRMLKSFIPSPSDIQKAICSFLDALDTATNMYTIFEVVQDFKDNPADIEDVAIISTCCAATELICDLCCGYNWCCPDPLYTICEIIDDVCFIFGLSQPTQESVDKLLKISSIIDKGFC